MIIGGRRQCGKTTELIKTSSKEWLYIICASERRVKHIVNMANQMNLDIPHPIYVDELPLRSPFIKRVLVDDIEDVLVTLLGKPVYKVTSSMELLEL